MNEVSAGSQVAASQAGERRSLERRSHARYPCDGGAEIRQLGVEARVWARLTDISLGGCYLESMSPLPPGTIIRLVLIMKEQRLQAKGQVVVQHPHFGMGVQFVAMLDADRKMLESWVADLEAKARPPAGRRKGEEPARFPDQDIAAVLQAIQEFFRVKPVMSREEFQQLVKAQGEAQEGGAESP